MKRVILGALATLMLCTACGGGSSGDAAGEEACQQWATYWASHDKGDRARALDAARRATSSERYKYLATDLQTYIDATDKLHEAAGGGGDPTAGADTILAVTHASGVIDQTCGRASGTAAAS